MLIVGNWKMNTDLAGAVALARSVVDAVGDEPGGAEVVLCPPFVSLDAVHGILRGTAVRLGAQDASAHAGGAFTGEVAAAMLASVGCRYCIVGHSERRQHHGEADATVGAKAWHVLDAAMTPIVCVGETLGERRVGEEVAVVERQLAAAYDALTNDEAARVAVAYEPVWAIGTGETASPAQAQSMHAAIRAWLDRRIGAGAARATPLLYGGSMNAANASDLLTQPDVDGGLIGGASLKPADFAAIVRAARAA